MPRRPLPDDEALYWLFRVYRSCRLFGAYWMRRGHAADGDEFLEVGPEEVIVWIFGEHIINELSVDHVLVQRARRGIPELDVVRLAVGPLHRDDIQVGALTFDIG